MINIRDAQILDILPHTLKTDEYKALSKAIKMLNAYVYDTLSSVIFWADIDNASPAVLDAMAVELDAPFYSAALSNEQKRSVIAAAFAHNSRVGTVSSMTNLLAATFGGGEVRQWYEYGGEPYFFRVNVESVYPAYVTQEAYDTFVSNLNKLKPVRAKLDGTTFTRTTQSEPVYIGLGIMKRHKKRIIPAATPLDEERGYY